MLKVRILRYGGQWVRRDLIPDTAVMGAAVAERIYFLQPFFENLCVPQAKPLADSVSIRVFEDFEILRCGSEIPCLDYYPEGHRFTVKSMPFDAVIAAAPYLFCLAAEPLIPDITLPALPVTEHPGLRWIDESAALVRQWIVITHLVRDH